jgi:hypothetical protein
VALSSFSSLVTMTIPQIPVYQDFVLYPDHCVLRSTSKPTFSVAGELKKSRSHRRSMPIRNNPEQKVLWSSSTSSVSSRTEGSSLGRPITTNGKETRTQMNSKSSRKLQDGSTRVTPQAPVLPRAPSPPRAPRPRRLPSPDFGRMEDAEAPKMTLNKYEIQCKNES